jgi:hypothetical protein
MANSEAQIKPNGLSQRNLVDLLYMIVAAIQGICIKLDADAGVNHTTHLANCFTAKFNGKIADSRGDRIMNYIASQDRYFQEIKPAGISDSGLNSLLYQIFDMMNTLTKQLDSEGLGDSNYNALVYVAIYLWMVTNQQGNTLGNGNTYWFNPQGVMDQRHLIDCLAAIVNSITVLTQKLDADATVTDTNYTALWYTAVILMQIQDCHGNLYGNASTAYTP